MKIGRILTIWIILLAAATTALGGDLDQRLDALIDRYKNPCMATHAEVLAEAKLAPIHLRAMRIEVLLNLNSERLEKLIELDKLVELFTTFSGAVKTVKFSDSADPAILMLKRDIGLAPPPGFVFIVSGVEITDNSKNSNVRGKTIWCRYIWTESSFTIGSDGVAQDDPEHIVSHELAHAYINSCIGNKNDNLPEWFHAGAALYFAGNKPEEITGAEQTADGDTIIKSHVLTGEYQQYLAVFHYLSKIKGYKKFCHFMRQSVIDGQVDKTLPQLVGQNLDFEHLYFNTSFWEVQRFFFLIILALWLLYTPFFLINTRKHLNHLAYWAKHPSKEEQVNPDWFDRRMVKWQKEAVKTFWTKTSILVAIVLLLYLWPHSLSFF